MPTADTARLIASLEFQDKNFTANTGKILGGLDRLDSRFAKSAGFWRQTASTAFGVGLERAVSRGVRGLFGAIQSGIESLREQGVVSAQTEATIRSTGGAANLTTKQIIALSDAMEQKTAIDNKQIQAGANMLLTFTNVRNEVGKGNDIFDQSVAILADMSVALGKDMSSQAIQLGKALNDPIAGVSALTEAGVTFDKQTKAQIKTLVEQGKVMDAQKIILAELNKEFGGSGAAFAATDAGKAAAFQKSMEGIQQALAKGLLPTVTRVQSELSKFLSDPATMGQAEQLGNAIAGIFSQGNITTAANAMTAAAGAVSTAVKLFAGLPKEVQALAVGAVALKKITGIGPLDIVKGASGALNIAFQKGSTPGNPLFVRDISGGVAGGPSVAGKGAGLAGKAGAGLAALSVVGDVAAVVATQQQVSSQNTETANAINQTMKDWLAQSPKAAELQNGLAGVEAGIRDITSNPLNVVVQGEALDRLKGMRDEIRTQLSQASLEEHRRGEREASLLSTVSTAITQTKSTLHGDLKDVAAAVRNMRIAAGRGQLERDPGPSGRAPAPLPRNRSGSPDDRNINITLTPAPVSIRDMSAARTIRARIGPTPHEAGAA